MKYCCREGAALAPSNKLEKKIPAVEMKPLYDVSTGIEIRFRDSAGLIVMVITIQLDRDKQQVQPQNMQTSIICRLE